MPRAAGTFEVKLAPQASGAAGDTVGRFSIDKRFGGDLTGSSKGEMLTLVETEKDPSILEKELTEKMDGDVPEAQIGMQIKQLTSAWFRYFLTYDPAAALRKVTCPVLAINGSLDMQVLPRQNLPAIRKALEETGNKRAEID